MPLRRGRAKARPTSDPLTACLDANGTYICTSFNPRCYIIQKVTTTPPQSSNPLETVDFKREEDSQSSANYNSTHELRQSESSSDGYSFFPLSLMNGNVSQPIAPRAVYNSKLHEAAVNDNLDAILSSERLEGGKYGDDIIQTVPPPGAPEESSRELLKKTLRKQLDFYFSTQNLASDGYLLSQMDKEQFVPVWTVANFNLVKKLTNDLDLITEALTECANVQLNETKTKVRPNYQRCVVILREIAGDTSIDDVKQLMTGDGFPSFISCEFAGNHAWYITYASDEDAQSAYSLVREKVKEFRGKQIHARIKAKPMIHPNAGGAGGGAQSGTPFKSWNPQHNTGTIFDPNAYPNNQQRFMFTNGTHAQMPMPTNQFFFPQYPQGPLIPTYVPAAWQAGNYYDINTVFQVNGLAPQAPYKTSYKGNGKSKKKTATGQAEQGAAAACSTAARQAQPHMSVGGARSNVNARGQAPVNDMPEPGMPMAVPYVPNLSMIDMSMGYGYVAQPLTMTKEPMPPRHRRRRREDENAAGPSQPQETEQRTFDLGHSAFPPLKSNSRRINSVENQEDSSNTEQPAQASDTMPWSDHRIVDILRGNTASKSSSTSTSSKGSLSVNDTESPRAGSPQMNEVRDVAEGLDVTLSSALTLTPPISPEKSKDAKCTMTDKSTKTDDVLLNGESEICPTTTNAATMTTAVDASTTRTEAPKPTSSNTPPRMSYAQVAQHPKEVGNHKEKKDIPMDGEAAASSSAAPVQNGDKRKDKHTKQDKRNQRASGVPNGTSRREKKEFQNKKRHNPK